MATVTTIVKEMHSSLTPQWISKANFLSMFDRESSLVYKKGVPLFAGTGRQYIYLVVKGMIKTYAFEKDKEVLLDHYEVGDIFNLQSLFSDVEGEAMAYPMGKSAIVKRIAAKSVKSILDQHTHLYFELLQQFNHSLIKNQQRLQWMNSLQAEDCLRRFILQYIRRSGRKVGHEWVAPICFTHMEIAQLLGLSRQTVTKLLNALRSEKASYIDRRNILLRNMDRFLFSNAEVLSINFGMKTLLGRVLFLGTSVNPGPCKNNFLRKSIQ